MGDKHEVSVPLNRTPDSFMSRECPACERIFKVAPGQGSPEPVTHCPYCNHEGTNCWWTKPQAKYIVAYGASKIVGPQLDKMARDFNRKTRGNDFLKMSMKVKKPPVPQAPIEDDDMIASVTFECCGETIRHDEGSKTLHCPICGTAKTI